MVLNQSVRTQADRDPTAPITEARWVDADPHIAFDHGDLIAGDDPRVEVAFTDTDGTRRVVAGDVVRFDAWSNYSGAVGGHNILIETDDEWVQSQDPVDDLLRVNTRKGTAESVVEVNRPGAGLNKRVASDKTAGDDIVVRPVTVTDGGDDSDDTPRCEWCGDDTDSDDLRTAPDGERCPECYFDPDPDHADSDFDVEDVRHVVTDREGLHLVAVPNDDVALCGSLAGGLTTFGEAVDSVHEAARLGAWVNARDGMCDGCRDVFNDAVFGRTR